MRWPGRTQQLASPKVTGNPVPLHQAADQIPGLESKIEELASDACAKQLLKFVLRTALTGTHLSTIAPGGSGPDATGFEQNHGPALSGEVQRSG